MNYYASEYLRIRRKIKKASKITTLLNIIEDIGFLECQLIHTHNNNKLSDEKYNKIYDKLFEVRNETENKIILDYTK